MQLSSSSVTTDPSLLSLLFPGAAVAGNFALAGKEAAPPTAGFEQLFAHFGTASEAAVDSQGEPASGGAPVLAWQPTPVAFTGGDCPPVVPFTGANGKNNFGIGSDATENAARDTDETLLANDEGDASAKDELDTSSKKESMPGRTTVKAARGARETKSGKPVNETTEAGQLPNFPTSTPVLSEKSLERLPNENAADAAFHTPRFDGLPSTARKNFSGQGLPPGISRHLNSSATENSAVGEESGTDCTLPSVGEASTDGSFAADVGTDALTDETAMAGIESNAAYEPGADATSDASSTFGSDLSETKAMAGDASKSGVAPTITDQALLGRMAHPRFTGLPARGLALGQETNVTETFRPAGVPFTAAEEGNRGAAEANVPVWAGRAAWRFAGQGEGESSALAAGVQETKANIAARSELNAETSLMDGKPTKKSFVSSEEQGVGSLRKTLGIDGAKSTPAMFTPKFETPAPHSVFEYGNASIAPSMSVAETAVVAQPQQAATDSLSTAHEAVEVVLHAVEHVASREQKSVNLKFSVGEAELSVRVEMHANEVRTSFHTDSSELRSALAQEWNNVSHSSASDRSVRIASAIFGTADQSALNSSAGDSSSRQRNPEAPRTEGERLVAAARSRSSVSNSTAVNAAPSESAPVASRTSRRLHVRA